MIVLLSLMNVFMAVNDMLMSEMKSKVEWYIRDIEIYLNALCLTGIKM